MGTFWPTHKGTFHGRWWCLTVSCAGSRAESPQSRSSCGIPPPACSRSENQRPTVGAFESFGRVGGGRGWARRHGRWVLSWPIRPACFRSNRPACPQHSWLRSHILPGTPGRPTSSTPPSCGGGLRGARPTGWTRSKGSREYTSSCTSDTWAIAA